jgi:hypothetical protein
VFTPVPGTPAEAPLTGLMVSAYKPPDDPNVRWEAGFGYVPERCGYDYQLLPWCDPDDPTAYAIPDHGVSYYRPPAFRVASECSTLGGRLDTAFLRRIAEATTPFAVARELWLGEMGATDSWVLDGVTYSNVRLADPAADVVTTTATTLGGVLAALEYEAADANKGQRIMIHLPITASGELSMYVDKVGSNLVTRSGNLVVIDAGYPGTGPNGEAMGATAWAYATSMVAVRTSPLQMITDPAQTVDRAHNTATAWAERAFAAYFDPCVHFAIQITI